MNIASLKRKSAVSADSSIELNKSISLLHTATLIGFADGRPLLKLSLMDNPVPAIAQTTSIAESEIGNQYVVMFDCGDPMRPVVIGKMATGVEVQRPSSGRMEIEADEELVLKCGKTCIKMTSDGTVAIRGANVITRASHTNRIRGGNVQIN